MIQKFSFPGTMLLAFLGTAHSVEIKDTTHISNSVSFVADSTKATGTIPLLPSRLGPMETYMWDEHGFMRNHFDFPLTEDGREKEMKLRRTMLTAHEIGGFATLAAMVTTCVVGQMAYNEGNHINPSLGNLKKDLGWATVFMYFGTASLAIFTPPPLVRQNEWSSVSTHKLLATVHFTGMILTPILASGIGSQKRGNFSRTVETVHMVSGYTTTAAFAAAMMVIVF